MEQQQLLKILVQMNKEIYQLLGSSLEKVVLYGSYARGDFTPDSDVDILILTNTTASETQKYKKQLSRILSRLSLEYNIILSMFLIDKESYIHWLPAMPFYQNIEKDGIVLYDAA